MTRTYRRSIVVALAASALWSGAAAAQGRIVVSHDEWFSTAGFVNLAAPGATAGNSEELLTNVATWFGPGRNYLAFSGNFTLTGAPLADFMTSGLGATWTVSTSDAAWADLASYDAVFVGGTTGSAYNASQLAAYVRNGGNVVVIGGTGNFGGAAGEAAFWNSFLGEFGLQFVSPYNGLSGVLSTAAFDTEGPFGAALFTGVDGVYASNGSSIQLAAGPTPDGVTVQVFRDDAGRGLFAAADYTAGMSTVPEPGSILLVATGVAVLGLVRRRRAATA